MKKKKCGTCFKVKIIGDFWKQKDTKDGLRFSCKGCLTSYNEKYSSKHSKEAIARSNKHVGNNKEEVAVYQKQYRKNNSSKISDYQKEYKILHKADRSRKERDLRINDVQFKLSTNLRSRLVKAIKGKIKGGSAIRDLGCTISELKAHLESKFKPGMTWDNWSLYGWHVDHIRPLASFDLTNLEQFKKACHYTNLQPLWAKDNLRKNKYGDDNGPEIR